MTLVRLGLSLKREKPMLRLVLLALYLFASYSLGQAQLGGGLEPNRLAAQQLGDIGGGLDPDGAAEPPTSDIGGGLDPNG